MVISFISDFHRSIFETPLDLDNFFAFMVFLTLVLITLALVRGPLEAGRFIRFIGLLPLAWTWTGTRLKDGDEGRGLVDLGDDSDDFALEEPGVPATLLPDLTPFGVRGGVPLPRDNVGDNDRMRWDSAGLDASLELPMAFEWKSSRRQTITHWIQKLPEASPELAHVTHLCSAFLFFFSKKLSLKESL